MEDQSLFGGMIRCQIPKSFRDVSDIRQVPDHQECWDDPISKKVFVIEILERQEHVTDNNAAQFFFNDLVEYNNSSDHYYYQGIINPIPSIACPDAFAEFTPIKFP